MKKHPIIVVGGGFGGVYTAKYLLKKGFRVLLISEQNFFTFTPLLHEVATGNLTRSDIIFEYESFFRNSRFEFLRGKVTKLDLEKQKVFTRKNSHAFSYVVLATGAKTNYFNLKGAEHTLPMKTIEEAVAIKQRLIELAQGETKRICVNVIGGGPTGVELILEIEQFLAAIKKRTEGVMYELRVIQGDKTILPFFSPKTQVYAKKTLKKHGIKVFSGTYATEATASKIKTTKGTFNSNLTIMTAGVMPRTKCANKSMLDDKSYVCVDDFLQIEKTKNAFALGDIIVQNGERLPKLAQTAADQAKIVAENIARTKSGRKLIPYKMKLQGTAISLGFGRGAANIFGIHLKGFLAWWLWRTIYLMKTPGMKNKLRVSFSWTLNLFTGKNLTEA